jgi:hypothetical protein
MGIGKKQFDQNMRGIDQSYNYAAERLRNNYNNTVDDLKYTFQNSQRELRANTENSLKEAYIKNMQNQKNFGQNMASKGLTGGASQTALASMNNNYSSGRNAINQNSENNLKNLQTTYQQNLTSAANAYNEGLNNLELQRLRDEMNQRNQYAQWKNDTSDYPGTGQYKNTGKSGSASTGRNGNGYAGDRYPRDAQDTMMPDAKNTYQNGGQLQNTQTVQNPQTSSIVNTLAQQLASGASVAQIRKAAYNAVLNGQLTDATQLVNIFNALGITA